MKHYVAMTGLLAAQENALAEEFTLSTGDVQSVHNQLIVRAAR